MSEVQLANDSSDRPWTFTVIRAHGLQSLRAGKSWRPIVTVTVEDHQCHELNLGCDGQNPNLKQCFEFHETDKSSRVDICIYRQAPTKKKSRKRNLVANACCTLQELARLQAQQQCNERNVEIKLNCISRQKSGFSKGGPASVLLIAKLGLPEPRAGRPTYDEEGKVASGSDDLSEEEDSASFTSESSSDPTFVWSEEPSLPEPRVFTGYLSDSDDARDESDPLLKHAKDEPIVVYQTSDGEDGTRDKLASRVSFFVASLLPTYTETIAVDPGISTIDAIVDSFSPYRELREARVDSDYERVLTKLHAEWSFVGGSLVALSGLEAGVFGFSHTSIFTISDLSTKAIAVGSIASGIGLAIDAWFLLAYSGATPAKFQKIAVDVYGKYLFFCITARLPALCMFISAFALMTFLLSVAWSAWPTAVLVMSFLAGILISLQFIVYGMHCVVVFVMEVARAIRRGVLRCLTWIRPPPPPAVREKHTLDR